MNRRAVAFAYALLGLLAIGGALAPLASAHPLTAESYPTRLFGEQTTQHVFTIEGGMTAKCPVAEFEGEITAATGKVELEAEYKGSGESKCAAFGLGEAASIAMNGCDYVLRSQEETAEEEFSGLMNVKCPEGQKITITAGTCEVQIGPQEGMGPVGYLNDPSAEAHKDTVTFKPEVKEGLRYNKTKDGGGCPLAGTGEKTNGSFEGTTSLAGSNPTTKAPLDVSFAAVTPRLEAETYPTELVGQHVGDHIFTFENGHTMRCTEASFSGELTGSPTESLLGVVYRGPFQHVCLALKSNFGLVTMNGCKWGLRANTETGEGQFSGEADLDCPPGAVIEMNFTSCKVEIGDQNGSGVPINQGLGPVTFVNEPKAEPEKDQVKVTFEISKEITYVKTIDPVSCPFLGTGTLTDGSYAGAFTLRGYSPAIEEEEEKITGEPHDLYVAP